MKIESFSQWRSFMKPKLPGGTRVYNFIKFNLNEYGFRRFPRKTPYFKFRCYQHPVLTINYQPLCVKYNRTIFINYSWDHAVLVHQLKEDIEREFEGIKVETVGNNEGTFSIQSESGKLLFTLEKGKKFDGKIDSICNALQNSLKNEVV